MSGREPTALRTRPEGFSLVVVLVFMMVIMMLGITAMQASGLQERMASHSRDRAIAFQATETALRQGEAHTRVVSPLDASSTCAQALCTSAGAPDINSYDWSDTKSAAVASTSLLAPSLAGTPRYFIEYAGTRPSPGSRNGTPIYRVWVHATGYNSSTTVNLQSAFAPIL